MGRPDVAAQQLHGGRGVVAVGALVAVLPVRVISHLGLCGGLEIAQRALLLFRDTVLDVLFRDTVLDGGVDPRLLRVLPHKVALGAGRVVGRNVRVERLPVPRHVGAHVARLVGPVNVLGQFAPDEWTERAFLCASTYFSFSICSCRRCCLESRVRCQI